MQKLAELNANNLGYSHPKHTKKGYNVLVNYCGTKPCTIETPVLRCPYGVDHINNNKCTMKLLIDDPNVLEILKEIDVRNSGLPREFGWFSNPDKAFYYSPFMENQSALRVRIPIKYGRRYDVEVFKESDDLATVGDINPGTKVKCTLEWKHIWIIDQTFGYFWTVKKIEIIE